ncbi:MAG: S8 family serine peptidase, partial [Pseudomonadales bacterium]
SSFHGTHVAGTVAAQTDNEIGVSGAGWNTRVMPLRVLGKGGGTTTDVIQAIRYAAGLANDSDRLPDKPVDIINMSLGGGSFNQAEQDAIDAARAEGVIVIASAGNESNNTVTFPAGYDGVVGVSATTITNELAFYSNTGAGVDVAAPGGDTSTDLNGDGIADGVLSTLGDDSGSGANPEFVYGMLAGTSMAAPHVAGVAALMRAEAPTMTPDQFDALLAAGEITDDRGAAGRDDSFGHGLINAQKALVAASGETLQEFIVVSPTTLNFGAVLEVLGLNIDNAGTNNATVNNVSTDAPWLTVTPQTIDESGAGIYELRADRSDLEDGNFRGEVLVETSANNSTVVVVMRVSELDVNADAGFHYIVLLDESGENVAQETAVAVDGRYEFQFDNVEAGRYELAAGSDTDNDQFICDAGEACGLFRTLDSPTTIELDEDLSGLEFITGFRTSLSSPGSQADDGTGDDRVEPIRIGPPPAKEFAQ